MNITEIKKLLEMFDASESVKLKLTNEGFEISLEKTAAKAQKVAIPANPANLQAIQSVESLIAPLLPSMTGIPASLITSFALLLSLISAITAWLGPIKVMP